MTGEHVTALLKRASGQHGPMPVQIRGLDALADVFGGTSHPRRSPLRTVMKRFADLGGGLILFDRATVDLTSWVATYPATERAFWSRDDASLRRQLAQIVADCGLDEVWLHSSPEAGSRGGAPSRVVTAEQLVLGASD